MIGNAPTPNNHGAVVEHYAQVAANYDRRWDRYTRVTLSKLLSHIDLNHARRVLDVACGTGRLTAMLRTSDPSVEVTGLDLSPEMIEVARRNVGEGDGIAWDTAPAESLPVEDASFDLLTCANAFHLVQDQDAALREFHRVVKPGGRVVIVDWCREYFAMKLVQLINPLDWNVRQIFTRDELAALMQRNGFDVTHRERFRATWLWGLMCMVGTWAE